MASLLVKEGKKKTIFLLRVFLTPALPSALCSLIPIMLWFGHPLDRPENSRWVLKTAQICQSPRIRPIFSRNTASEKRAADCCK